MHFEDMFTTVCSLTFQLCFFPFLVPPPPPPPAPSGKFLLAVFVLLFVATVLGGVET